MEQKYLNRFSSRDVSMWCHILLTLMYQRCIRSLKSKDRQNNGQTKTDRDTNNGWENTAWKTKDWSTRTPLKTGTEYTN